MSSSHISRFLRPSRAKHGTKTAVRHREIWDEMLWHMLSSLFGIVWDGDVLTFFVRRLDF
jgi:hypothetical protein